MTLTLLSQAALLAVSLLLADGGLGFAVMATLAIGLSAASYFLQKSPKGPKTVPNFTPTTLSQQGSILPLLIGRARLGCIMAWAGLRFTLNEEVGGGGGGGGLFGKGGLIGFLFGKGSKKKKGGGAKQTIYYESAWHLLCVGPAQALHRIWQDGRVIWEGSINAQDDPSGSTFVAQDGSEFAIYWGEPDQPVDATLAGASAVGIPSRWPHVCFIVWHGKRLGTSPRWPQLEYDVETLVYTSRFDAEFEDLAAEHDPRVETGTYGGPNPGWILGQVMFETYPHGCALPFEHFSIGSVTFEEGPVLVPGSFTDMVDALADEELAFSAIAADGKEAAGLIAEVMQDAGVLWVRDYADPYDIGAGLNAWTLVRAEAATAIPPEAIFPTETQTEVSHIEVGSDRLTFEFRDLNRQFKASTIAIDEDGQAALVNTLRARKVELPTVIHQAVANIVGERRAQEELAGGSKFTVFAGRSSRTLMPGRVFSIPDVAIALRLTEVWPDSETDKVELGFIGDYYGAEPATYVAPEVESSPGDTGEPAENILADFFEVPELLGERGVMNIVPLRVRGDTRMSLQVVHLSLDGSTYREVNRDRTVQVGGLLTEDMDATGWIFEDGPTIEASSSEILEVVEDLTADEASWKLGRQMCLIGEELFFLQGLEALGGDSYRLKGLIRARGDTERAAHAIDDPVIIFLFDETEPFFDVGLAPFRTLYIKQQPAGGGPGAVALGDVDAQTKTLVGKGIVPMKPGGLRVTAPRLCRNEYESGDDVTLAWGYRSSEVPGTGAGLWNAGDPVGRSPVQGAFELQVLDTDETVMATIDEDTLEQALTYTITNVNLVTWFAGEPDAFLVRLRNVNRGFRSPYVERRITLV